MVKHREQHLQAEVDRDQPRLQTALSEAAASFNRIRELNDVVGSLTARGEELAESEE